MENQKITNLLGNIPDKVPLFITKKWIEVHDHSGDAKDRYKPSKPIRFKTSMLRSNLCDYSDAYIVVLGDITPKKAPNTNFVNIRNRFLAFQNNVLFTNCISKINNILTDNAEDLVVVIPTNNLIEYSKYY